jgi:hypothetical protein
LRTTMVPPRLAPMKALFRALLVVVAASLASCAGPGPSLKDPRTALGSVRQILVLGDRIT